MAFVRQFVNRRVSGASDAIRPCRCDQMPPVGAASAESLAPKGAQSAPRWTPHPVAAASIRLAIALIPIAASVLFVIVASRVVQAPSESLVGYLGWWVGLCGLSTLVRIGFDKLSRRLLPLSALLRLSLVFPDQAPSRFKIALRSGTVRRLQVVVDDAKVGRVGATPAQAVERVLELVAALNAHDRMTRGHSERVRAYTQMIGEELALSPPRSSCCTGPDFCTTSASSRFPTRSSTNPANRPTRNGRS